MLVTSSAFEQFKNEVDTRLRYLQDQVNVLDQKLNLIASSLNVKFVPPVIPSQPIGTPPWTLAPICKKCSCADSSCPAGHYETVETKTGKPVFIPPGYQGFFSDTYVTNRWVQTCHCKCHSSEKKKRVASVKKK